jgi:hypothetical protein
MKVDENGIRMELEPSQYLIYLLSTEIFVRAKCGR